MLLIVYQPSWAAGKTHSNDNLQLDLPTPPVSLPDMVRDSVGDMVPDTVPDSVRDMVPHSVRDMVPDSVRDMVRGSVPDMVPDSVRDTVRDMVRDTVRDMLGLLSSVACRDAIHCTADIPSIASAFVMVPRPSSLNYLLKASRIRASAALNCTERRVWPILFAAATLQTETRLTSPSAKQHEP